ncbi:hypothetical protein K7472_01745 [Streptomyces sp. PTM05]|uniref:Uncharacterized protein n=1 Tax=Streptantibioticus parmotrematis TaxID=2873249 RepID=A0ABS7QK57_9ACTN|nr:hypothetical protein [Streptantibioticus parmotrematis]MBY8883569.1 hypothetical protein [Streptantibioticus parmotrematis]
MTPEAFREFFTASAGASGALIGLLFVAITVAPERAHRVETQVEFRVLASAALLVFTNALVLSLVALVPQGSLGYWALLGSVFIVAFAAATARSGVTEGRHQRGRRQHFTLAAGLVVIAAFEAYGGVLLMANPSDRTGGEVLCYIVVADLLLGIGRAWQLTSMRDTGLVSSLRVLAHGEDLPPATDEPESGQ